MRYKTPPIEYSHEVELALKLHLVSLREDYEHVYSKYTIGHGSRKSASELNPNNKKAVKAIMERMKEVEKGLELFGKWLEEPEHNLEDEAEIRTNRESL